MFLLKFLLNYIKNFIILNPFKLTYLFLIVSIFFLIENNYIETYEIRSKNVVKHFEDSGKYHYVIKEDNYNVISSNSKLEIIDKKVYIKYIRDIIYVLYLVIGILLLALFFATFINDSDIGWEFMECRDRTFFSMIKMDEDDGKYYYHINGKLINESNYTLDSYTLTKHSKVYFMNKDVFRDFKGTKQQIRENKINDILK